MLAVTLVCAVLTGCGSTPSSTPTATPTPEPTSTPTVAPSPTETPAPTATATPAPTPTPTPPALTLKHCPGRTPTAGGGTSVALISTNWSGYVAGDGRAGGATCVEGAWVEPVVTCPRTGLTEVAIWVGLDGFTSDHLGSTRVGPEQVGTDVVCDDGGLFHEAWWQTYPSLKYLISFGDVITPASGDHMWAQVAYSSAGFTMTLTDLTSQQTDAITRQVKGATRLTAEWVVEAPSGVCSKATCPTRPLARFSRITFSGGEAVIAGRLGSIGDRHWSRDSVIDETSSGTRRTTISGLSSTGLGFSVVWHHV